jgi:NTE family protein
MIDMGPSRSAPEVAFVLPAGGSAGAVQVGILASLVEAGIFPDVLVGCSVGALNAAFFALDPTVEQVDRLGQLWADLSTRAVFGDHRHRAVLRLLRKLDHLWSPAPLRALIRRCCPIGDLAELALPVHVVTTDLDVGVARWWSRGPAEEVLYASACLPGLLPPALLNGHRHVDGGVLEPVPISRAVDLDATTVYVLGEANGTDEEPAGTLSALDVLVRSFAISRYGRLPDPVSLARSGQCVIVVPGASTAGIPLTDFSHTDRLQSESRAISRRFLAARSARQGPGAGARCPSGYEVLGPEEQVEGGRRERPHERRGGELCAVSAQRLALGRDEGADVDRRGDAVPRDPERKRPGPGLVVEGDSERGGQVEQRAQPVVVEGGPEHR